MNIFYAPNAALNQHVVLDEQESFHITRVLRKKVSEELYVFDGKGNLFDGRISAIGKKEVTVHLVRWMEKLESDRPKLHIAIAPPKNIDRFEWFLEKATEIGVDEITPLLCKHSERKDLRTDRLEKVLVAACKQSLKYQLPKLNEMQSFDTFVSSINGTSRKYLAYCDEKTMHLKDAYHGGFDAVLLIGPEGDFTREEVLLAGKHEFETVSLGKSRLRLETAGVYAAAAFNLINDK